MLKHPNAADATFYTSTSSLPCLPIGRGEPPASQGPAVVVSSFLRRGGANAEASERGGRYVLYFHVVPALESSSRTPEASSSFRIRSASAKSFRARAAVRSPIRRRISSLLNRPST